jgi:Prokaryotic E2 family E
MLAEADTQYLLSKGLDFEVTVESGMTCVVVKDYALPEGYDRSSTDLLIRLPAGFPDAQPDMFWCDPAIRLSSNGGMPQAADAFEIHLGRTWQRFSRHLPGGAWRPGTDDLGSWLSMVGGELARTAKS